MSKSKPNSPAPDSRRPLVYVAGPYTAPTEEGRRRNVDAARATESKCTRLIANAWLSGYDTGRSQVLRTVGEERDQLRRELAALREAEAGLRRQLDAATQRSCDLFAESEAWRVRHDRVWADKERAELRIEEELPATQEQLRLARELGLAEGLELGRREREADLVDARRRAEGLEYQLGCANAAFAEHLRLARELGGLDQATCRREREAEVVAAPETNAEAPAEEQAHLDMLRAIMDAGKRWRGCEYAKAIIGNAILGAIEEAGGDRRQEIETPAEAPAEVREARLRGTVFPLGRREPIAGVRVIAVDGPEVTTAADGTFELWLPAGRHAVILMADGYEELRVTVAADAGDDLAYEYRLGARPSLMRPASCKPPG